MASASIRPQICGKCPDAIVASGCFQPVRKCEQSLLQYLTCAKQDQRTGDSPGARIHRYSCYHQHCHSDDWDRWHWICLDWGTGSSFYIYLADQQVVVLRKRQHITCATIEAASLRFLLWCRRMPKRTTQAKFLIYRTSATSAREGSQGVHYIYILLMPLT